MAESGLCGISSHNTIGRLRIHSIHTRKTRALSYRSFGGVPTAYLLFPSFRDGRKANEKSSRVRTSSSKGWKYSYLYASAPLFAGECGSFRFFLPTSVKHRKIVMSQQAAKEDKSVYTGFPPMQKKPRWYWRVLTCFPYLISFHVCWVFAETVYNIHPFLEDFEFFTYPFLVNAVGSLPGWFFTAYFIGGYLGIVRNNKFPHFLRFHIMNGMLLEILFSICGQINDWLPRSFYWGKLGQFFWFFISIAFFWTVMFCIFYALRGWYADVPFISDAAYMQIPY